MTNVYEIMISMSASGVLQREIREYRMLESSNGTSFTATRKGSIGTYTIYENAMDKRLANSSGHKYFTKDKKKLKEYCTLLDEYMSKYIDDMIKTMTKNKDTMGTPWESLKKTNNKAILVEDE